MNDAEKATAFGSVMVEVTHVGGTKENVPVRQLPMKDFQSYIELSGDIARKVELICGRPEGWANSLTPESALAVAQKGDEVNPGFFALLGYVMDARSKIVRSVAES